MGPSRRSDTSRSQTNQGSRPLGSVRDAFDAELRSHAYPAQAPEQRPPGALAHYQRGDANDIAFCYSKFSVTPQISHSSGTTSGRFHFGLHLGLLSM
jgi:hypothetical protein